MLEMLRPTRDDEIEHGVVAEHVIQASIGQLGVTDSSRKMANMLTRQSSHPESRIMVIISLLSLLTCPRERDLARRFVAASHPARSPHYCDTSSSSALPVPPSCNP